MVEIKSSPVQHYKSRVGAIKDILPANWKEIIIKHYPQYNTVQGGVLINNVSLMRASDVKLTEIMERIAKKELA